MPNLRDRLVPLQTQPSGGLRSRLTPTQNTQPHQPFTTGVNAAGIKIVNPQGVLSEKRISNIADVEKKKQFEAIEKDLFEQESLAVQGVIDSLMAKGRPITEIGPEELLSNENVKKIGIDNIGKIKKILDSYKKDKQDSAKQMATSGIREILAFSNRLPTSSGIYGLHFQGPQNTLMGFIDENIKSALVNLDSNIESTLASLAKAFGEVGNLSQFDQESYRGILKNVAHPNAKVRSDARKSLQNRLNKDMGFDIKVPSPYQAEQESIKLQNQSSGGFSIDQKAIEEELKRRGR